MSENICRSNVRVEHMFDGSRFGQSYTNWAAVCTLRICVLKFMKLSSRQALTMGAACAIPYSRHVRAMFELCSSMGFGSAAISLCEVAATGPKKIVFWNECCLCGKVLHVCSLCVCGLSGSRVFVCMCVMTNSAS